MLSFKQVIKYTILYHIEVSDFLNCGYAIKRGGVNPIEKKLILRAYNYYQRANGVEIQNFDGIDEGLTLAHPYAITINPRAVIGKQCTIFKGATIGSVRGGKRMGVPVIGNRVVIGTNAFVCGGITIGDDVLIAANAFIDTDVPSNSIVIGNPGVIHSKNNPTKDYINNEVL